MVMRIVRDRLVMTGSYDYCLYVTDAVREQMNLQVIVTDTLVTVVTPHMQSGIRSHCCTPRQSSTCK